MQILYDLDEFLLDSARNRVNLRILVRKTVSIERKNDGAIKEINTEYTEGEYFTRENSGIIIDRKVDLGDLPVGVALDTADGITHVQLNEKSVERIENGFKLYAPFLEVLIETI